MPRFGIISDIHANLAALERVLDVLDDVDQILCLGDVVGYGPDPGPCIDMLRDRSIIGVRGNHDDGILGNLDDEWFSEDARAALCWQRKQLSADHRTWLESLRFSAVVDGLTLVHGMPPQSHTQYMPPHANAICSAMRQVRTSGCLVGHTHIGAAFVGERNPSPPFELSWKDVRAWGSPINFRWDGSQQFLLNPGSVGQPRDGSPLASFAVIDTHRRTVTVRRVEYPVAETQRRILEAGLPTTLADRLLTGR